MCDAQDAVELFSSVAESENETGSDNGVSATGDKREERDLYEVSLLQSFFYGHKKRRSVRCPYRNKHININRWQVVCHILWLGH